MRDFECDFFDHFVVEIIENDEIVSKIEQFDLFNNEIVDAIDANFDTNSKS